ncbi:acetyltransferase [Brevibacillus reuszeri]|uniref:Acetyltransferase n=1 Tax=Brevibacillus reuszeri TaxID=54915 RepID=A0A0K9YTW2_9BACL|nr:GNAT family protein [Brevibacillus reuszeri]KNB72121.1 acetyltransferase [Brevibacillus reuszeri]MED1855206.1 GNAT family protein [Brevibacillus reuszeri]GED67644.1 acetyltransferase [Brevibacillus reuszeri]
MIRGNLVELRPVTAEDMERLYVWRNDEEVATWAAGSSFVTYSIVSLDTLRTMYEEALRTSKLDDKLNQFIFSVYTLDGVHIGNCDYRQVDPITRAATIGIGILAKEYWSKGYGTDTLHALLRFLFLKMNLNRVQLDTWSGNTRAIRAYEKCGFVLEGRLRQNEYIDGQYHDTILMGLLREDYLQIK